MVLVHHISRNDIPVRLFKGFVDCTSFFFFFKVDTFALLANGVILIRRLLQLTDKLAELLYID